MSNKIEPRRIRRERRRGWRKPTGAVIVDRTSRWGNPYRPVRGEDGVWVVVDDNEQFGSWPTREEATDAAVELFADALAWGRLAFDIDQVEAELGDTDLICWCPLDGTCHADILLTVANPLWTREAVSA